MEKTYIMLKPGFVNIEKEVIARIEKIGGKVLDRKLFRLSATQLKEHYAHLLHLPFYGEIESYMMSNDVVGFIIEGDNIIEKVRTILGPTKNAPVGTIRGDYAKGVTENVLHASDSPETAKAEMSRFFD